MDDLAANNVADYTEATAQLGEDLSDPGLTDVERSLLIDRYFNETLKAAPASVNIRELQVVLEDELSQYGIDPADVDRQQRFGSERSCAPEARRAADAALAHLARVHGRVVDLLGQASGRIDHRIPGAVVDIAGDRGNVVSFLGETYHVARERTVRVIRLEHPDGEGRGTERITHRAVDQRGGLINTFP